jgi:hypothetical protein
MPEGVPITVISTIHLAADTFTAACSRSSTESIRAYRLGGVTVRYREGVGTRLTAWAPKGKEPRPNTTNASHTRHTHTRQGPEGSCRRGVLVGSLVHQEKGSKEHLTFSSGDVGGEPLLRRGAGEVGEAGLEGGAEHEELVLRGEGKGRERSHPILISSSMRAGVGLDKGVRSEGGAGRNQPLRAVGDALGGSGGSAHVRRRRVCDTLEKGE